MPSGRVGVAGSGVCTAWGPLRSSTRVSRLQDRPTAPVLTGGVANLPESPS